MEEYGIFISKNYFDKNTNYPSAVVLKKGIIKNILTLFSINCHFSFIYC